MKDMHTRSPDKMLLLSNKLLDFQGHINRHEQAQVDILGFGDPVLSDEELCRLNILGRKIWKMKRELAEKTARLRRIKRAYYDKVSRQFNRKITIK